MTERYIAFSISLPEIALDHLDAVVTARGQTRSTVLLDALLKTMRRDEFTHCHNCDALIFIGDGGRRRGTKTCSDRCRQGYNRAREEGESGAA